MLNYQAKLDQAFQALADPTRRAMLDQLIQGPASVTDLAKPLSISLPGVLQHLAVLEASGLVRSQKRGRVRTCSIEASALQAAELWLGERRAQWEARLDRLGQFLEAAKDQD